MDPVVTAADARPEGNDASSAAQVDAPPPAAQVDARPPAAPVDARPPAPQVDARPPVYAWSDAEKCENMCQSYCVHRYTCDGSDIDDCRMAIDEADGGTCSERARLFADIPQSQVEACIAAIQAMSCSEFLRMFNTGEGVPAPCHGILI